MANATRLELKSIVRAKRPGILGNTNFPNAFLDELINQAQRFVQINLAHLGIKEWEASDTLTINSATILGVDVKAANLSTDCPNRLFDDERAIKYLDVDDKIAFYVDDEELFEQTSNSFLIPTASQPIFTRLNQQILIYPNTATTVVAYYYKQVADMTTDATKTEIPEMYEEHIIKRVLIDVDDILGKLQTKQADIQQLTNDIQQSFQANQIAVVSDIKPKTEVLQ